MEEKQPSQTDIKIGAERKETVMFIEKVPEKYQKTFTWVFVGSGMAMGLLIPAYFLLSLAPHMKIWVDIFFISDFIIHFAVLIDGLHYFCFVCFKDETRQMFNMLRYWQPEPPQPSTALIVSPESETGVLTTTQAVPVSPGRSQLVYIQNGTRAPEMGEPEGQPRRSSRLIVRRFDRN
ncbi:hypothetical protein CCP2SC5_250010 [Azospirillaceae bacterium]